MLTILQEKSNESSITGESNTIYTVLIRMNIKWKYIVWQSISVIQDLHVECTIGNKEAFLFCQTLRKCSGFCRIFGHLDCWVLLAQRMFSRPSQQQYCRYSEIALAFAGHWDWWICGFASFSLRSFGKPVLCVLQLDRYNLGIFAHRIAIYMPVLQIQ